MPFFYYIQTLRTVSPRLADEWPPVGGEPNNVLWKIEVSDRTAKSGLASLDSKFRKKAQADLSQEF